MTVDAAAAASAAAAAAAASAAAEAAVPPIAGTFDVATLQGEQFHALFPEDIRAKPYLKDINNFADFTKKFDGAQMLIGQKVAPGEAATKEEWDAWFTKAGRPEKPDGYVFPEIAGVPKEYVAKVTETGLMSKLMHDAGLNNQQAQRLYAPFIKVIYDGEAKAKADADISFDKTMDDTFGKDRATVIANGKKMLSAYVPENVKPLLDGLDDKAWSVLLAATDGIVKKHISEDGFRGIGAGAAGTGPDTQASITAEMRGIMTQKEYSEPHLDRTKHAELSQKMEALRVRLRKIS